MNLLGLATNRYSVSNKTIEELEKLKDMEDGKWFQLTEKEMLEELLLFIENLTCDCRFITHHTVSTYLNTDNFLKDKQFIIDTLNKELENADFAVLEKIRNNKKSL